jgi:hypothetical protein
MEKKAFPIDLHTRFCEIWKRNPYVIIIFSVDRLLILILMNYFI